MSAVICFGPLGTVPHSRGLLRPAEVCLGLLGSAEVCWGCLGLLGLLRSAGVSLGLQGTAWLSRGLQGQPDERTETSGKETEIKD